GFLLVAAPDVASTTRPGDQDDRGRPSAGGFHINGTTADIDHAGEITVGLIGGGGLGAGGHGHSGSGEQARRETGATPADDASARATAVGERVECLWFQVGCLLRMMRTFPIVLL